MMSKYFFLLLFPLFLGCKGTVAPGTGEASIKPATDTLYLSLYFIRNDEVHNSTEGEILIFGKYASGKYIPVTDYDTITFDPLPESERKTVFKSHKSFTTYYKGKTLVNVPVEATDISAYDCEELLVGKCSNKISAELIKEKTDEYFQSREGVVNGTEIQYSLINFFALSSNVSQPENIFADNQSVEPSLSSVINEHLKARFKSYCDSLSPNMVLDRKFMAQLNFKNERSPVFVSIATCSDTIKEIFLSMMHLFRIADDKIVPLLEKSENVGIESWGHGYEFIDAVDIDGDNNPELIFRVDGYEWSGLEIYRYGEGKFKRVFKTVLYGC